MSNFKVTEQKGFHITFENGWSVSVQFGRGNYCQNYNLSSMAPVLGSSDAEVAAWDAKNKWFEFEDGNSCRGNMKADEVLAFMNKIAAIDQASPNSNFHDTYKHPKKPHQRKIEIDISGSDGNAFVLLGYARQYANQLGIDSTSIIEDMMSSDYENMLEVFDNNFGDYIDLVR